MVKSCVLKNVWNIEVCLMAKKEQKFKINLSINDFINKVINDVDSEVIVKKREEIVISKGKKTILNKKTKS